MQTKKKVILYGASEKLARNYYSYKAIFNIVGISDSNPNKKEYAESFGERYILPEDISSYEFDQVIITALSYREIHASLTYVYNIDRNKIIKDTDLFSETEMSLGELNPEKTFYILRAPSYFGVRTGLFNIVRLIVGLIYIVQKKNYEFYIDFQNYPSIFLEDSLVGKENAWEYFFKQPCGEKGENVFNSKNVILGSHYYDIYSLQVPVNKHEFLPQFSLSSYENLPNYGEIYKKNIVLSDNMQRIIEEEYCRLFRPLKEKGKKICGVLYRGTEYTKLRPCHHYIQPTIEQVIDKTKQLISEWGFEYVYFDSEDNNAFKAFCKAFPDKVIFSERARVDEYPDKIVDYRFNRENDKYLKAMEYVRSCYLMARCDFFVGALNNGTNAVMLANDSFENHYLFNLGVYGIEEEALTLVTEAELVYLKEGVFLDKK